MHTVQRLQHTDNLLTGEDGWETLGLLGAYSVNGAVQRLLQDLGVEEQQRAQGLILGGRGDTLLDREVGQKGFDLGQVQLLGMAFAMEQDEALDPADVGFFAKRVVLAAQDRADAVQQARRVCAHR